MRACGSGSWAWRAPRVGPAAQVGRARGAGGMAVERACWAGVRRVRERGERAGPREIGLGREEGEGGSGPAEMDWAGAGKRGSGLGCLRSGRVPSWAGFPLGFTFPISIYSLFSILIQTKVEFK